MSAYGPQSRRGLLHGTCLLSGAKRTSRFALQCLLMTQGGHGTNSSWTTVQYPIRSSRPDNQFPSSGRGGLLRACSANLREIHIMVRRLLPVTLGLCLCAAVAPAALAQDSPPVVTEHEAHAVGVDAYV